MSGLLVAMANIFENFRLKNVSNYYMLDELNIIEYIWMIAIA